MLIEWRTIFEFPNYSVSNEGMVRSDRSGMNLSLLVNRAGVVNVGLTKEKVQYKRAVAPLVAKAFELPRPDPAFDCPINLDGDRFNNRVPNLAWRPRWYAVKYFQQFDEPHFEDYCPVQDVLSERIYHNPWDVCRAYGLLHRHVLLGISNGTPVWPTGRIFQRV